MPRINIEDELSFDPRFQAVVREVGNPDTAIGMAYRLFRLAQRYWGEDRQLIPHDIFALQGFEIFLKVGLAKVQDDGIYVCGTRQHLEWYAERKDAARIGGQKSAEARREKYGTAVPTNASNIPHSAEAKPKQNRSNAEAPAEAKPNPLPLALSPAPTHSLSLTLNGEDARMRVDPTQRKKLIHRYVTGTVAMLRRIDDSSQAMAECPPVVWKLLEAYFPDNTWVNWRTSLKQHIERKAEKYFRLDMEKHFDSYLPQ